MNDGPPGAVPLSISTGPERRKPLRRNDLERSKPVDGNANVASAHRAASDAPKIPDNQFMLAINFN